jgi:hypothetical protein
LLGKISLNSLYGLMGGLPQNYATVFGDTDSAGLQRLRRRRMNEIVVIS